MASSQSAPRYLRFVQALALGSGAAAAVAGCYVSHEGTRPSDAGARPDAVALGDAAPDAAAARDGGPDAPFVVTCADCTCGWGDAGGAPACDSLGLWECCAAVGPCLPPDLPA